VKDQGPGYKSKGLSAQYRAIVGHECPAEVLRLPVASDDGDAVRQALLVDGVEDLSGLGDRNYLLEFADGKLAGPVRLTNSLEQPRRYFSGVRPLSRPLPAWPERKAVGVSWLVLEFEGRRRLFFAPESIPPAPEFVDYASPHDVLHELELDGGIGSLRLLRPPGGGDVEDALEPFLRTLSGPEREARHRRIEQLLLSAATESGEVERSEQTLREHPAFRRALALFRKPILPAVPGPVPASAIVAEVERTSPPPPAASVVPPASQAPTSPRRADGPREVDSPAPPQQPLMSSHPRSDDMTVPTLTHSPEGNGSTERRTGAALPSQSVPAPTLPRAAAVEESAADARALGSVADALDLLARNLQAVGLAKLSALSLAREAVAGASLGQPLFFSGSFAVPVAHVVARSLAGRRRLRVSIPVGLLTPVSLPTTRPEDGTTALILEGINRSCLGAYGDELVSLLVDRALGLRDVPPGLLVIGTLLDGPSVLPPTPALVAYGPVLATDYYTWRPLSVPLSIVPGSCNPAAWKSVAAGGELEGLADLLEELSRVPNALWEHNVLAAGRCLLALAGRHGTALSAGETAQDAARASLLFGWVVPFLASQGISLADHADRIRGEFSALRDQRLVRFLKAHHVEAAS
jgi:hypothetical protein